MPEPDPKPEPQSEPEQEPEQTTESPQPEGTAPVDPVEAAAAEVVRLTDDSGDDWNPIWSPDGTQILFTSTRASDTEIFAMSTDGSGVRQLTADDAIDWVSAEGFSPDGSRILFTGNLDGDREIFVMNADGTGVSQLTSNDDYETDPIWSPDGSRILFTSDRDGGYGLYTMRPDGTGVRQLTESGTDNFSPDWSPDGSRILFTSDRDGERELFIVDSDGSNERRLTDNDTLDFSPDWSPDGTRAVFWAHEYQDDDYQDPALRAMVALINGDGKPIIEPLTSPETDLWDPAWSPDGGRILFTGYHDGQSGLYVMDADGSDLRKLTDAHGAYWSIDGSRVLYSASWSPDGTQVLFASDHEGQSNIYVIGILR